MSVSAYARQVSRNQAGIYAYAHAYSICVKHQEEGTPITITEAVFLTPTRAGTPRRRRRPTGIRSPHPHAHGDTGRLGKSIAIDFWNSNASTGRRFC